MWDKHRRIREDSRKRALRAAQARAKLRGTGPASQQAGAAPVTEASGDGEPAGAVDPALEKASDNEAPKTGAAGIPAHDPAGSLAWTGLIFLSIILGGFALTLLFMLG